MCFPHSCITMINQEGHVSGSAMTSPQIYFSKKHFSITALISSFTSTKILLFKLNVLMLRTKLVPLRFKKMIGQSFTQSCQSNMWTRRLTCLLVKRPSPSSRFVSQTVQCLWREIPEGPNYCLALLLTFELWFWLLSPRWRTMQTRRPNVFLSSAAESSPKAPSDKRTFLMNCFEAKFRL